MKLSELVPHTAEWTGVSDTHVTTVSRALRPADLLSSQGRGPGGAEMTTSDKVNLLLGVLGGSIANRAADHVRVWRDLTLDVRRKNVDDELALFQSKTLAEFLSNLTDDIATGGPFDKWLQAGSDHDFSFDFFVDANALVFRASRISTSPVALAAGVELQQIEIVFEHLAETEEPRSQLIRRLPGSSFRGWAAAS